MGGYSGRRGEAISEHSLVEVPMKPFRFVHIADVHLDTPFLCRENLVRKRLREALRQAFARAVDLVLSERAHALLIAGDLFDNDLLSFTTEGFLLEQMARLREAGVPVFYATGNHDPGRTNYRAAHIPWPDNVHLFRSTSPETVPVRDAEGDIVGYVTGVGHVTARQAENLAQRFPSQQEPGHVALLHAWVRETSADPPDRCAPCSVEDLRGKGYAYWALGHIHSRHTVCIDPLACYPGNLQGRTPREIGVKGGLLVEVTGRSAQATFYPLSTVRWETAALDDLKEVSSSAELHRRVKERLARVTSDDTAEFLLRVVLRGPCPLHRELGQEDNLEALATEIEAEVGALYVEVDADAILRPVEVDDHRDSVSVLGTLLALIDEARSDDELARRLAEEELAAVSEGEVADPVKYIRSLLVDLEEEAVARMVADDGS